MCSLAQVWYHRNEDPRPAHGVPSYYENVMRTQGLRPEDFPDPLLHRTFGAALSVSAPPFTPSPPSNATERALTEDVEGAAPKLAIGVACLTESSLYI